MKKTILLIFCTVLSVLSAFSTNTYVPPQYEDTVSGVWKTGSVIRLFNSILIPPGESLTIQPGVTVLICDTGTITSRNQSGNKLEIDALGDFYCLGTQSQPIVIKVNDSLINTNSYGPYGQYWGSIFTDTSCHEFIMTWTNMSNTGYVTTNTSYSVQLGLFKAAAGETTPEICYRGGMGVNGGVSPHGKLVVEHDTFHNTSDDCVYVQGGNFIIANNTVYTEGETGGDCFDIKSGSWGDICYNLVYNPNTNGVKLANTGGYNPTIDVVAYNNTILKAGWRRPNVKGGSIWLESGAIGHIYNNMVVDCRFGLKNSVETNGGADTSSRWDYQYYFGQSQVCINQYQPYDSTTMTGTPDVVAGPHDVRATSLKNNDDPMFVNFPFVGTDTSTVAGSVGFFLDSTFNLAYNFHLKAGSPAIGKGTTNVTGHWNTTGISFIEGLKETFTSPLANSTPGAFGGPVTNIVVSPTSLSLNVDSTKALTATVTPFNADTLTYTWTSRNTAIATVDDNGNVKGIASGSVYIVATSNDNPNVRDSVNVTVSSGTAVLSVTEPSPAFTIYPNPVQSQLTLQFNATSEQTNIAVYSSTGQAVISKIVTNVTGENTMTLSVDSLPQGLYFIVIQNGGQVMKQKFIKL